MAELADLKAKRKTLKTKLTRQYKFVEGFQDDDLNLVRVSCHQSVQDSLEKIEQT